MQIPFVDLQAMHAEIQVSLDHAWHEAVGSSHFIGGQAVERFESEWAAYCGTQHCVGVANGTAALELTLAALGIGPGDEVIVPANTFIATPAAVVAVGAKPVFVDVDPSTLLLTAEGVQSGLTANTAAVIPVHLYGQPADMDAINRVASAAAIYVIEDAAQAHGATWNGKRAGSLSHAGCFSFYPGKNLGALGDAGAVVTDDSALAARIRCLSNHGRSDYDPYRHDRIGSNDRLDALQAAMLSIKLTRLDGWNERRRRAAAIYAEALAGLPVEFVGVAPAASSVHHLAVVQTDARTDLRRALASAQIATGIHYPIPCHRQKPFAIGSSPTLPVCERAAERILSLPMFPHITEAQIGRVADVIAQTLAVRPAIRVAAE